MQPVNIFDARGPRVIFGRRTKEELDQRLHAQQLESRLSDQEFDQRLRAVETKVDPTAARTKLANLWSDGLGRLATRAAQLILVLVVLTGAIWLMVILSTVAIPILLALIFASTFWPLTRWLRRRRLPNALIAVIELFGILLILAGVGWLVTWAVTDQWDELSQRATEGFDQLVAWLQQLPINIDLPSLEELKNQAMNFITSAQFGTGALAGVSAVATFVTGLLLMVVVLFFFLKDGPDIWDFMKRPFSGEGYARAERVGQRAVSTLGSYVRGTATVALVDAVFIGIGLLILGVPLALPLSVLVFILSFIPLVGAVLAGGMAALVALVANSPFTALLVIGLVVLVNQLEGNLLQPVVMGRALKLHALVVLLALTVGTIVAGILGAVLAVPIAAVIWGAVQVWDGPDLPAKAFRAREVTVDE